MKTNTKSRVFRRRFPLSRKSHVTPPRRWMEPTTMLIEIGKASYEALNPMLASSGNLLRERCGMTLSEIRALGGKVRQCENAGGPFRMEIYLPRRPARLSPKLRAALGWQDDLMGGAR